MRRRSKVAAWIVAAALVLIPRAAADEVVVLATIPDLGDIAERVGGERVEVTTVARGTENIHAVALRPSSLVAANRADLFLQVGLSLEHAWVPGLLERSRNRGIQPGQAGFVNTSDGFPAIQIPEVISRSQAVDLHPQGNPHINLDPRAGRHFAEAVLTGLTRVDPDSAEAYRAGHARYLGELSEAEKRWAPVLERLRGSRVVAYHGEFAYLAASAGIEVVALLEPKPGVPPTPGHLANVVRQMRELEVDVVLTAKWSNGSAVRRIAEETGAQVLELPTQVRGAKQVDSWIGLIDHLLRELEGALVPTVKVE
ncbi:MAG: metal ABC transporter substrate-binding protein [Planctomycetota bacterium]|jgi:zinc/manganese transport system substrate-binding protein